MTAVRSEASIAHSNARGSTEDRRRRREYLVRVYRADRDADPFLDPRIRQYGGLGMGDGEPACRCYRCGCLLTVDTVTADRIVPGCKGGTYRRSNIRPACFDCNHETGKRQRR